MAVLSLREAAEQTEKSKVDIWRAIQEGALQAQRTEHDGFAIDPCELFRVFERRRERNAEPDAAASPEAPERPESATAPETAATNDMAVAFSVLGADVKNFLELPAEAPANDELRQNREGRQAADLAQAEVGLAERNAELAEPVAAKAEKAIAKYAALEERAKPWWRRLAGWIHTRRSRAARQRLRERL